MHLKLFLSASLGMTSLALAGGYQMQQRSVAGLGRALSGESAIADDASVLGSNPAGALWLGQGWHVSAGASFISSDVEVKGTFNGLAVEDSPGEDALVPYAYLGWNPGGDWGFGLAFHAPYAQHTDYAADFAALSLADETEFTALAIRPSVAWRISPNFAVGASLDITKADGMISSSVPGAGSLFKLEGDDVGVGYSLGLMWDANPDSETGTRVGLQFRSKTELTLDGKATSDLQPAFNSNAELDVTLPETVELSIYHKLEGRWAVHGDIFWTNWSRFQNLQATLANGAPVPGERQNWDDAWRFAVGATYEATDKLTLRAGVAWDETPVPDDTRALRNPGSDGLWLSVGATWEIRDHWSVDAGYTHIFTDKEKFRQVHPTGVFEGESEASFGVFGLQLNGSF